MPDTDDALVGLTRLENTPGQGLSIDTSVPEMVHTGAMLTASLASLLSRHELVTF